MSDQLQHIELSDTEVEGMITGGWEPGAEVRLNSLLTAECVDGEVWRVVDQTDAIVGYVNPTNCVTGAEIETAFREVCG